MAVARDQSYRPRTVIWDTNDDSKTATWNITGDSTLNSITWNVHDKGRDDLFEKLCLAICDVSSSVLPRFHRQYFNLVDPALVSTTIICCRIY